MLANAASSPQHHAVLALVLCTNRAPLMSVAYVAGAPLVSRRRTTHKLVFQSDVFCRPEKLIFVSCQSGPCVYCGFAYNKSQANDYQVSAS